MFLRNFKKLKVITGKMIILEEKKKILNITQLSGLKQGINNINKKGKKTLKDMI